MAWHVQSTSCDFSFYSAYAKSFPTCTRSHESAASIRGCLSVMHGTNDVPHPVSLPILQSFPTFCRQVSCRVPTETADEVRLTASPLNRARSIGFLGRVPGSQTSAASLPSGRLSGYCTFSSLFSVRDTLCEESAWTIGARRVLFRPRTLTLALSWRTRLL
jgi:hypothetical protein